jgi:signal transduction histidine kinase/CheY-like chemotaxis protein
LEIEDSLVFRTLKNESENIDFTAKHYWVRFQLTNTYSDTLPYIFLTARPVTDRVDLYQIVNGLTVLKRSGDGISFSEKNMSHPESSFEIKLPPNSTSQFYMHLESDGEMIVLPMELYSPLAFLKRSVQREYFFGLFYGLLLLASIVYLFFYKSLINSSFLFYGLYILSFGLLQFSLDGYSHQYFFPNSGFLYSRLVLTAGAFSTLFLGFYSESFLKLKEHYKLITKLMRAIYVGITLLLIAMFINNDVFVLAYPIMNGFGLLLILIIGISVVHMKWKKKKVDPFFILGILFLILGFTVFILNNFSVIPSTVITQHSSKIGSALEVIFLSLSMSNLIKQLREEKEKSQKVALRKSEEANELKLYFMSNMSHELRTPLNAIMGISDRLIMKEKLSEEQKKDLGIVLHSSRLLLNAISNIQDFYKIERRVLKLEQEPINLLELVQDLNKIWSFAASEKGLTYTFKGTEAKELWVLGDSERFIQLTGCLIENAIKFTPKGEIEFSLDFQEIEGGGINLQLTIQDTGIGITPERLEIVTKEFSQERVDDKRVYGGFGLGLAIARKLVKLHGGTFNLDSEKNKGTTCSICIPYQLAKPVVKLENQVLEKIDKDVLEKTINILVVEDNALNQLVMRKILALQDNLHSDIADNGVIALEALKKAHYDLILMDLQMPEMDGYEATEVIRSGVLGDELVNIPIVAVTADATEEAREKCLALGMNAYMTKPVTPQKLLSIISKFTKEKPEAA